MNVDAMTEFVQDFCYDRNCLLKKASRQGFGTRAGSLLQRLVFSDYSL